jgi:cytochrome P450 family 135
MSRASLPPGPRMPTPAQAALWALRPLEVMERCHRRYGDLFTLRVRRRPWVLLSNPEHVKQVFTTAPELVGAGAAEANPLLGPLLGPSSVMLLDEPGHMRDRKRMVPAFHGELMADYGEMMSDVARREIAGWPMDQPFALWPRMQAISLEVVVRATFGEIDRERFERLREHLVALTNWINDPRRLALLAALGSRSLTARRRFRELLAPVEQIVLEEVRERRALAGLDPGNEAEERGILATLERSHAEGGSQMDDQKLRDELITLVSDGPTATSLAWAFERLLRHPDKLDRLREEVLEGESEKYLDAVVKEVLRMCPAVPLVMRRLIEPMELGPYRIPADTIVAPCVHLMHQREDVYPDARVFRPERFLDASTGTYTWIPFGGGVRRCVAAVFAPLEMRRVIRVVLEEVDLKAVERRSEGASRSSVSFAPDGGALVTASRRRGVETHAEAAV